MFFFGGLTTCEIHHVYKDTADNSSVSKGTTTAHFVKFINELLDKMIVIKIFKGNYTVMDNASIHKYRPLVQKISKVKATKSCTSPLIHQNSAPSNSFGQ